MRKISLIALAYGLVFVVSGFVAPVILELSVLGNCSCTEEYCLHKLFNELMFVVGIFGVPVIISALFCLFFGKSVSKHCTVKTSIISLALSMISGLGLCCFFIYFCCVAFDDLQQYPIEYPASVIGTLLCLALFIIVFCFYVKCRKENVSVKGVVIDVLFALLFVIPFFFASGVGYNIISKMIR